MHECGPNGPLRISKYEGLAHFVNDRLCVLHVKWEFKFCVVPVLCPHFARRLVWSGGLYAGTLVQATSRLPAGEILFCACNYDRYYCVLVS